MFESAPRDILKDKTTIDESEQQKRENEAVDFSNRVICYTMRYGVYGAHRLLMIRECCNYLQNFLKEHGNNTWPANCREPVLEFRDVVQILIYAIADKGFLFDEEGFWRETPNTMPPDKKFGSPWQRSHHSYADLVYAIKRRNYTYMDLQQLRRNLDEHDHQDKLYMDDGVNPLEEEQNMPERNIDGWFRNHYLRMYVTNCAVKARIAIDSLASDEKEIEKISQLLQKIESDRCLKKVAPMIIFGVLLRKIEPDIRKVKAFLKPNSSCFDPKYSVRDCRLFQIITETFPKLEKELFGQKYAVFDPIALITGLNIRDGLQMTDEEMILLAHLCEDCIKEPQKKKKLKEYTQSVNGVAVGAVMEALLTLFQAQGYAGDEKKASHRVKKPRGLKSAIERLHQARIDVEDREDAAADEVMVAEDDTVEVEDREDAVAEEDNTVEQTEENDENAGDEVAKYMEIIRRKYFVDQYDYNWEVFWMISGYTPPPLVDWEKFDKVRHGIYSDPFDLYSIFNESIKEISDAFLEYFVQPWDDVSVPQSVRYDAATVRTIFAQYLYRNKNGEAQVFFRDLLEKVVNMMILHPCKERQEKLVELCVQKYMEIAPGNKKNLKSFEQYEDVLGAAMADEVVKQLCAKIYDEAFQMLNLCNKYFWSVT